MPPAQTPYIFDNPEEHSYRRAHSCNQLTQLVFFRTRVAVSLASLTRLFTHHMARAGQRRDSSEAGHAATAAPATRSHGEGACRQLQGGAAHTRSADTRMRTDADQPARAARTRIPPAPAARPATADRGPGSQPAPAAAAVGRGTSASGTPQRPPAAAPHGRRESSASGAGHGRGEHMAIALRLLRMLTLALLSQGVAMCPVRAAHLLARHLVPAAVAPPAAVGLQLGAVVHRAPAAARAPEAPLQHHSQTRQRTVGVAAAALARVQATLPTGTAAAMTATAAAAAAAAAAAVTTTATTLPAMIQRRPRLWTAPTARAVTMTMQ
jgi:hypothetical protein